MCDEENLELGEDMFTKMTVVDCLRSIGNKLIMYYNDFPLINRTFLS